MKHLLPSIAPFVAAIMFFVCGILPARAHTFVCPLVTDSVAAPRPFEGHFVSKELGVHLHLNLYEENLLVPGSEFLGKVHGYMHKGIYGTWMLITHEIKGRKALLRFSNDIGSDSQNIEFEQMNDSVYHLHAVNGNALRKAVGRKLVKVADHMEFRRQ